MTNVDNDSRPDPEILLANTKETRRGRLKLFFGAAPGVGKTYAMLTEAQEKRREGIDVLIGWVDTHQRKETEALLWGLDVLPRLRVKRGRRTEERLDIDEIIRRHPALVIIDEMPHSNPPGSRHPKRWQDIEEILEVGIDVWTAMNVQHLESLNGIVERVTGVSVNETIPDRIFDGADEVRLVDLPPEDLLKRLAAGKIYLAETVARAKENFFKRSNLIALRELALRSMASRMESQMKEVRAFSARRAVDDTSFGLLLVLAYHSGEEPIREAARIARSLSSPWHVIWIDTKASFKEERLEAIERLRFAQELGAETEMLMGDYVQEIARYARSHNLAIVALVPGRFLGTLIRKRLLHSVAPELNILTLASREKTTNLRERLTHFFVGWQFGRDGYVPVTCIIGILTLVLWPLHEWIHLTNLVMIYLLAVLFCGVRYGTAPAAFASILSVLAFDLTMVSPRWSFAVTDTQYLITFSVMLAVGLVAGQLVSHRQRLAIQANEREHQTRLLYDAARLLSKTVEASDVTTIIGRALENGLGITAEFWLTQRSDGDLVRETVKLKGVDQTILRWCWDHKQAAGIGTHTLASAPYHYWPLVGHDEVFGVTVCKLRDPSLWQDPTVRRLVEALLTLASQTLERLRSVEDARQVLISMEAERLRHSLIQSLSHDLRTPLTMLSISAETILKKIDNRDFDSAHAEGETLLENSRYMERLVTNLLEMARLQSGEIHLKKEWIPADEIIGLAISNLKERLKGFDLSIEIDPGCPPLYADAQLIERVLTNLLDNASKYCPKGSKIVLKAQRRGDTVTVSVADNGPGVPKGNSQRLFDPFRRGQKESNVAGVGLGLAICRTIARVHDADLVVTTSTMGGACFTLALPFVALPDLDDESLVLEQEVGGVCDESECSHEEKTPNRAFDVKGI